MTSVPSRHRRALLRRANLHSSSTTIHGSRVILLLFLTIPVHAMAQSETPWAGASFGVNMGDMSGNACSTWTPGAMNDSGAGNNPATANPLSEQTCTTGGHFVGGVQLGENFQYKHFMWGLGIDLDTASSKNPTDSVKYTGATPPTSAPPPAGTYTFSGRQTPNGFAIIAPRVGYAGTLWLPYLRAGALIASGAHNSTLTFTPVGATTPTA
jgi:hypothetical protein